MVLKCANFLSHALVSMFPITTSIQALSNSLLIMIIGQDECIFLQFILSSKMWVGLTRNCHLPESEGEGQIISAFQSREFGFGLQISADQLSVINEHCCQQNYINTVAATEIFGSIEKKPLLESLFIWFITIGINNDSYWMSYHMAIQLEDCVDCLKVCFPNYDFVFLFDTVRDTVKSMQEHYKQQMSAYILVVSNPSCMIPRSLMDVWAFLNQNCKLVIFKRCFFKPWIKAPLYVH